MPQGHALLLGAPGSGKIQAVDLAARLIGYDCRVIPISSTAYNDLEFSQELKRLIITSASTNDKPVVVVCEHDAMVEGSDLFLERVHSFLNIELLSLIFQPNEISGIIQEVRLEALASGRSSHPDDILTYFHENLQKNVHIVLCLNPYTPGFAERMLKFPGLAKLMSVDWFIPWGQDDLYTMGSGLLKSEPGNLDFSLSVDPICQMFIYIHHYAASVNKENRARNSAGKGPPPPSTFVELVKTFLNIFKRKREDSQRRLILLKSALKKTEEMHRDTDLIESELVTIKPQLAKAIEDTTKLEEAIAKNSKVVSDFWKVVHAEEMAVSAKGTETAYLEAEAQKAQEALDAHVPVVNAALAAVRTLTKQELIELRGLLPVPPDRILRVLEAICILRDTKPTNEEVKRLLLDPPEQEWFSSFDKNQISVDMQNKLKKFIQHPEFVPSGMEPKAARVMCAWVIAVHKYAGLFEVATPKRDKVSDSSSKLDQSQKVLKEKREALALVEEKLAQFNKVYKASNDKKEKLERKAQSLSARLSRSERLATALQGSEEIWNNEMKQLDQIQENLVSYSLIVAGFVVYLGMHPPRVRLDTLITWKEQCEVLGLSVPSILILQSAVDPAQVRTWHHAGLPNDPTCIQNAVLVSLSARWPLLIDPHGVARKWVKGVERANQLRILSPSQHDFVRALESAITAGRPVLVDNAVTDDGEVPRVLDDLLRPLANSSNLPHTVRIINEVSFNKKFKLYLLCRLPHPHLKEHLLSRVNAVDFNVSLDVIESQLLSYLMRYENQQLNQQQPKDQKDRSRERERERDKGSDKDREQEYQEHYDQLLVTLAASEGDVLDNEPLVAMLMQTRTQMQAIKTNTSNPDTQRKQDESKERYRTVAQRGALLYEIIMSLRHLNPLYQFNLHHFTTIFKSVILKSVPSTDVQARVASLLVKLNQAVFSDIGRCLFLRHRMVFAFMLAVRIQQQAGYITDAEWKFLLSPSSSISSSSKSSSYEGNRHANEPVPSPSSQSLPISPPKQLAGMVPWGHVTNLDKLIHGLEQSFTAFPVQWKQFIEHDDLASQTSLPLPDGWDDKITVFQRLLVLMAIAQHKVMPEIFDFISKQLGVQFVAPEGQELDRAVIASSPMTPIVLISPHPRKQQGVDVMAHLSKFVLDQGRLDKFVVISLGEGEGREDEEGEYTERAKLAPEQAPTTSSLLLQALTHGHWVFIHHIHRNPSWLAHVEDILDNISSTSASVASAGTSTPSASTANATGGRPTSPAIAAGGVGTSGARAFSSTASPASSNLNGFAPSLGVSTTGTISTTNNSNSATITSSLHSDFRLWLHCVEGLDTQVPVCVS